MTILRRLAKTLTYAVVSLDEGVEKSIYIVFIPDNCAPTVTKHETQQSATERIFQLQQLTMARANQNTDYYILVFHGTRWHIVQGDVWKLHDGNELLPAGPQRVADYIDESGLIGNASPIDEAVAAVTPPAVSDEGLEELPEE